MSGAEPAYAPYRRFARDVLVVDLAMGAVVLVVSIWQGWTSVEESTLAIFGGGVVLLAVAILPMAGGLLNGASPTTLPGGTVDYAQYRSLGAPYEAPQVMHPRATLMLLVAGSIPLAYATTVAAIFL